MWLSFIDNPKMKSRLRKPFRESAIIPSITRRYVCFLDHTVPQITPLPETDLEKALTRFRDVKKVSLKLGASFPKIVTCGKTLKSTSLYVGNLSTTPAIVSISCCPIRETDSYFVF